ncbi:hypothetical protein SEVIR_3G229850v4 [Setaria viridis]
MRAAGRPAGREGMNRKLVEDFGEGLNAPGDDASGGECQKGGGRAGDSRAASARDLSRQHPPASATLAIDVPAVRGKRAARGGGICTRHCHRRAPPAFVGRHARRPFPIFSSPSVVAFRDRRPT